MGRLEGHPSPQAVGAALARMVGRRALLVGDFVLDTYIYGETARVSREAPVLVVRKQRVEHRLGGAANTAQNLAALGLQVQLLGVVGDDAPGHILLGLLRKVGVDTAALRLCRRTTPVKTRILAGAYGTLHQQVLRLDDEPSGGAIDPQARQGIAADLRRLCPECDVVVVSDYGAGLLGGVVLATLQELAGGPVPICVDSRHQLHAFVGAHTITPNVPEAEVAVGFPILGQADVERAGAQLLAQLGCTACLLTQGRHGMTLFRPERAPVHVPIVGAEEVTDVTGAGDTVIATLAASLAADLGLENAMRLANCAAGIVVTKAGAAIAAPNEIVAQAEQACMELVPWAKSAH